MAGEPSRVVIMLGGLTGAAVALLGILLGSSVANLSAGSHGEVHEHASEPAEQ